LLACSWDALVLLGVVATMILVPLRVGFKIHYVWVEAVLDAVFVLDVLLNFETGTAGGPFTLVIASPRPRRYFLRAATALASSSNNVLYFYFRQACRIGASSSWTARG
jgi:hypothetical protein